MPNYNREHYPPEEKMLSVVIWHLFFGDLSQSERKNSEIKLALEECTHLEEIGLQAHLIDGFG